MEKMGTTGSTLKQCMAPSVHHDAAALSRSQACLHDCTVRDSGTDLFSTQKCQKRMEANNIIEIYWINMIIAWLIRPRPSRHSSILLQLALQGQSRQVVVVDATLVKMGETGFYRHGHGQGFFKLPVFPSQQEPCHSASRDYQSQPELCLSIFKNTLWLTRSTMA